LSGKHIPPKWQKWNFYGFKKEAYVPADHKIGIQLVREALFRASG